MADPLPLPITLLELLSNSLLLGQITPYIPFRTLLNLASTSKPLRNLILSSSEPWRYLDLSRVSSARIESTGPLDIGGISWRSQRMDEALTEDEFYAGPLRGIFSKLRKATILRNVQTLILDGLSVPADLVREIATEPQYSVRILSIREALNLNQSRLQQILRYLVRPTRAEGTPRLRGLYFFGAKRGSRESLRQQQQRSARAVLGAEGVMASEGAQIGAAWNQRSSTALFSSSPSSISDDEARWYSATGRAMKLPLQEWAETLRACAGLIAFDAVLCRGPRHDITKVDSKDFLQPAVATVALGPGGCEICGTCPEGPAVFGLSSEAALPLLGPVDRFELSTRAAQRPSGILGEDGKMKFPKLILRCEDCLRARWCERCNRWWCEECYVEPRSRLYNTTNNNGGGAQHTEDIRDELRHEGWEGIHRTVYEGQGPQGVHRDCLECGRTCEACKTVLIRRCRSCREEFCVQHDDGCSRTECAWCSGGARRTRTVEMY